MPEAGYLPIPKKLASAGVKDMLRISDARMSGTAFGSVILHVSPDAASGGPLALVENGDRIRVSVSRRSLDLLVDEQTLAARRAARPLTPPRAARGYTWLHHRFMTQAEDGCDFSFLRKQGVTP
jgi:dihydroxy-acid dehydratase